MAGGRKEGAPKEWGELEELEDGLKDGEPKEEPKEKDDKDEEGDGGGREKEANEDVMSSISLLEVSSTSPS